MEIKYGNEYEERTFENLKLSGELFKKYKFTGCRFINCSFEDCELNQCSFSSCVFEKCQIISLKANNDSQAVSSSALIGKIYCQAENLQTPSRK